MQWVSSIVVVVVMLLAAATANLKGKLSEKMRWRPTQMVMKKMPDGTAELSELPRRKADAVEGDKVADDEYCQAVARVANAFGRQRRSVTTAAEHVMYMRMFDGWLVENKQGSFVEVTASAFASDFNGTRSGAKLVARKRADGTMKVRVARWPSAMECVRSNS